MGTRTGAARPGRGDCGWVGVQPEEIGEICAIVGKTDRFHCRWNLGGVCGRQKGQERLQVCGLGCWMVIFMKMRKLQKFEDLQASAYKLFQVL